MKFITSTSRKKVALFQWLTLFFIGISISTSLQAAQSVATSMAISVGTLSGAVGNLSLASEGKIVNLYTNGSGNLTITLKFPANALSSQVDMSAYVQQKTGSDRLSFQALNALGTWVSFGTTVTSTAYQRVISTLPSSVVINGIITIRIKSNSNANDFKLDQMILVDKVGSTPLPSITSLTATPSSIITGQSSTLNFSATGATSLILNPGNINVSSLTSLVVTPSTTTTYTLTASNNAGSVSSSVGVTVSATLSPPSISSFTASPSAITAGQSSTLNFATSGATSLIINPGNINVSGRTSLVVTPSVTTNYTLTASNSAGSASASIGLMVSPLSTNLTIPVGTKWYWQLQGTLNTSLSPKVYDIDLYDTSTATISSLKSAGHIVICNFSAGTYEDWRSDAGLFPASALGTNVDGWAGEKWLDVRNTQVRSIMTTRMDLAKSKGCDGLEPDNVDGYDNGSGFPLTSADQINFNKYLADQAHARGLVIALKNATALVNSLVNSFDFAVVEECFKYNECDQYSPFIAQNKAVLNAEYTAYSSNTCTKAANLNFSTAFFNLDLNGSKFQPCP